MAMLPTDYIVAPTGASANKTTNKVVEVKGGVVVGVTSATDTTKGQPITEVFRFSQNAIGDRDILTTPKESASVNSTSNQTGVLGTAGTFAYNQVQFMIRTSATKINNIANTTLLIPGYSNQPPHQQTSNKSKGAKTSTAWRAGYWNAVGIAGQRTNWSTAPATNNVNYVLPTNNASNAADQAQFVTYKLIPGELAYMDGSPNPIQDEYKAATGG